MSFGAHHVVIIIRLYIYISPIPYYSIHEHTRPHCLQRPPRAPVPRSPLRFFLHSRSVAGPVHGAHVRAIFGNVTDRAFFSFYTRLLEDVREVPSCEKKLDKPACELWRSSPLGPGHQYVGASTKLGTPGSYRSSFFNKKSD
jgi:hypothetical protein